MEEKGLQEMRQDLKKIHEDLNQCWDRAYTFWDVVDNEFSSVKASCLNAFRVLELIDKRLKALEKSRRYKGKDCFYEHIRPDCMPNECLSLKTTK